MNPDPELLAQLANGREVDIVRNGVEWANDTMARIKFGSYDRRERAATDRLPAYTCWRVTKETGKTQAWIYKIR